MQMKKTTIKVIHTAKYILIFFVLMQLVSLATPTIRFERTDVEGKNSEFITATYSFGIDIIVDSLEHCSNVTFELYHNQTQYVNYDYYLRSEDWLINNDWSQVVTIVHNSVDKSTDKATIVIEAGTIGPADINSPNNPKIIHLAFVVAPSAINGGILEFTIDKIRATYYKSDENKIVDTLTPLTFKVSYNIHSFVNVWPGDTDCDGKVDTYDNAVISLYLTYPKNCSRSFKRQNPSVLWQPQLCIAWDTLSATYADCDGNGMVTSSDYAIVYLNYDSLHFDFCKVNGPVATPMDDNMQLVCENGNISRLGITKFDNTFLSGDNKTIPISIENYDKDIVGVAGIIDYSDLNIEIEGIKSGDLFGNQVITHFFNNKDTKMAAFCIAMYKNIPFEIAGNNIAELYIKTNETDKDEALQNIIVSDFIAFNNNGDIQKLKQKYTSVELENEANFYIAVIDNKIILHNVEDVKSIFILDYMGTEVANYTANNTHTYSIAELNNGVYFVLAKNNNKIYTYKFIIYK